MSKSAVAAAAAAAAAAASSAVAEHDAIRAREPGLRGARQFVLRVADPSADDIIRCGMNDASGDIMTLGAAAQSRYLYRPHGIAAYADGVVQPLETDRESMDYVAEMNHRIRKQRFIDVLSEQEGHSHLSEDDMDAMCHVLAEDLPVPLMMHLLMIRHRRMRFTIRGQAQAYKLGAALRSSCRRIFGTVEDYAAVCERLTYAPDVELDGIPEMDALSVLVDFTYVYGPANEANRYLVIWKPDAGSWLVARRMNMRIEPFFWLYENTNEEVENAPFARLTITSVKFLPVRYRKCPTCANAILPKGPFIYDKASTYFTALMDNVNLCLCGM